MTKDQMREIARRYRCVTVHSEEDVFAEMKPDPNGAYVLYEDIISIVEEAVSLERERCAQICDDQAMQCEISNAQDGGHCLGAEACADTIRQSGE